MLNTILHFKLSIFVSTLLWKQQNQIKTTQKQKKGGYIVHETDRRVENSYISTKMDKFKFFAKTKKSNKNGETTYSNLKRNLN